MKKLFFVLGIIAVVLMIAPVTTQAQWSTSGTDMYNTNAGKVGIGDGSAFTPSEKFTVANPTDYAGIQAERPWAIAGGNAPIGLLRLKNSTTGDYFNFSFRYRNGNHEVIQSAYYAPTLTFKEFSYFNFGTGKYEIRNGVAETEYKNTGNVLFNNTGGVGIGVASLGSGVKFQVAGKIKCQEVEVAITPWPDHVFKTGYQLRSLEEVEAFIATNKHLPDVPSEAEVAANGVNVGQMNATLLQKIEELTLYMINLKKENDLLKDRIQNLEKK